MRKNMGLHRGKRTDNDEWINGYYVHLYDHKGNESHRIYPGYAETDCGDFYPDWFEVDPETVGQFVGMTDKNETNVFEGDIFKTKCNIGVIRFRENEATFGFEIWWIGHPDDFATFKEFGRPGFEIIGNVHDNPELLNPDHPELVEVCK